MTTEINYWWIGVLVLGIIILITWLLKRDRKDQRSFEKEIIESEIKPEKHDSPDDKTVSP
jgi:type VI protein secretion system component VasK